jgi:hypothetical protein
VLEFIRIAKKTTVLEQEHRNHKQRKACGVWKAYGDAKPRDKPDPKLVSGFSVVQGEIKGRQLAQLMIIIFYSIFLEQWYWKIVSD